MKTRILMIAATFAFVTGVSVAGWPQQSQSDGSQSYGQKLSANHKQEQDMKAQEAKTTKHKDKANADATDSIDVVGHLAFDGAAISNIRTTEDQTRPLLEVTDKTSQTLNLVDVSDPGHPKVVQRMRKPGELQNSRLEFAVGDAALFAEMQDLTPKPRSISIVSFGDRAGTKTVRRFENVTALWADRGRGFIYLANPEGLWILQPHSQADSVALQKQYDEWLRNSTAQ